MACSCLHERHGVLHPQVARVIEGLCLFHLRIWVCRLAVIAITKYRWRYSWSRCGWAEEKGMDRSLKEGVNVCKFRSPRHRMRIDCDGVAEGGLMVNDDSFPPSFPALASVPATLPYPRGSFSLSCKLQLHLSLLLPGRLGAGQQQPFSGAACQKPQRLGHCRGCVAAAHEWLRSHFRLGGANLKRHGVEQLWPIKKKVTT